MKAKILWLLIMVAWVTVGMAGSGLADSPKMKMTTPIPESISTPDKLETSIGTLDTYTKDLKKEKDGSYVIYFGPDAPKGHESNWLQSVPGKAFFVCLRMYGPTEPWIESKWRPSNVDLVK